MATYKELVDYANECSVTYDGLTDRQRAHNERWATFTMEVGQRMGLPVEDISRDELELKTQEVVSMFFETKWINLTKEG